ncbi:hypothetical protein DESA109040_10550 [Deinococcus saxicola]|uniref:hypothetical protein n=1 Tax=Deinococcus saxicola TaxID=249406 RepID=UPI0039EE5C03
MKRYTPTLLVTLLLCGAVGASAQRGEPISLKLSIWGVKTIKVDGKATEQLLASPGSVNPGETVEYCIVYTNTGGAAGNFVLQDYVPVGMVAQLSAYGTSGKGGTGDLLGLKYAAGVALAVGDVDSNTVTPKLTSKGGNDVGALSTVPVTNPGDPAGSPQRPGVMTLTLPSVAGNSRGTVCFQAKVP